MCRMVYSPVRPSPKSFDEILFLFLFVVVNAQNIFATIKPFGATELLYVDRKSRAHTRTTSSECKFPTDIFSEEKKLKMLPLSVAVTVTVHVFTCDQTHKFIFHRDNSVDANYIYKSADLYLFC